ncbi:MAG: hypothetical protein J3R72DRAFT_36942 [Linnemannia gamsii]|nr:MAG: hypothetical protein J3R72DRAFT_36942 [Linnemannia gamsii]
MTVVFSPWSIILSQQAANGCSCMVQPCSWNRSIRVSSIESKTKPIANNWITQNIHRWHPCGCTFFRSFGDYHSYDLSCVFCIELCLECRLTLTISLLSG